MDFTKFKESYFYRSGLVRYDIVNHRIITPTSKNPEWERYSPIFRTSPMMTPSSKNLDIQEYTIPHNQIGVIHLLDAIRLNLHDPNENINWLSPDFRAMIKSQWIEVSDVCESIISKYKKESNSFELIRSALIITGPGVKINPHKHACKQVVTLCYKLSDQEDNMEPSHMKIGADLSNIINFPDGDKIIFSIKNDPQHEVISSEWRFWWVNDFSDCFDLPENLPFIYWDNPLLDNKNISP